MANWKSGIKLLLSAYNGERLFLTSKKNDFSDFIRSLDVDDTLSFIFRSNQHFDNEAFEDAPGDSTKGTKIQHHFNNFALSPSRANDELQVELDRIKTDGAIELPLKCHYTKMKWLAESMNTIFKSMSEAEFDEARAQFKSRSIPFIDIFELYVVAKTDQKISVYTGADPISVIFYGPPGTGKTRGAIHFADSFMKNGISLKNSSEIQAGSCIVNSEVTKSKNWFSVQFHPSFSYEDFFEGLRPVNVENGLKSELTYEVVPGVFKVIAQLARANYQPGEYGIEVGASVNDGSIEKWVQDASGISELYRFNQRNGYFTYQSKKVYVTGEELKEVEKIHDETTLYTGKARLKWYSTDKKVENFILFIDELNRGNPARIFGEALSLIEPSKRLNKVECIYLNLPYSHEKFSLPPNLHILGAMNSSDKSLAHLDQAFRRRFKFIYLAPNFEIIKSIEFNKHVLENSLSIEVVKALALYFEIINKALEQTLISTDKHVGHSYAIDILMKVKFVIGNKNPEKDKKIKLELQILSATLARFWQHELHGLLRDIVSEYELDNFIENFFNLLVKNKEELIFMSIDEKLKNKIEDYLKNAEPVENKIPMKEAA